MKRLKGIITAALLLCGALLLAAPGAAQAAIKKTKKLTVKAGECYNVYDMGNWLILTPGKSGATYDLVLYSGSAGNGGRLYVGATKALKTNVDALGSGAYEKGKEFGEGAKTLRLCIQVTRGSLTLESRMAPMSDYAFKRASVAKLSAEKVNHAAYRQIKVTRNKWVRYKKGTSKNWVDTTPMCLIRFPKGAKFQTQTSGFWYRSDVQSKKGSYFWLAHLIWGNDWKMKCDKDFVIYVPYETSLVKG